MGKSTSCAERDRWTAERLRGIRVLVLMGGPSAEHDISLMTGQAVVEGLSEQGILPIPVMVTRERRLAVGDGGVPLPLWKGIEDIAAMGPACAFIAMHGPFGEDGRIQGLLDYLGIPYVGSDTTGSALAMDKWLSKLVYRASGIVTPKAILLEECDFLKRGVGDLGEDVAQEVGVPCVVKPVRLGSSVGCELASDVEELCGVLQSFADRRASCLCEAFVEGTELTCAVLENPETFEPHALPVIEIRIKDSRKIFDYSSKYDPTLADELCPAPIPEDLAARVAQAGVQAHKALRLSGFSRTDFIFDGQTLWALETNSIPGLTKVSLYPKAAAAAGISYSELLCRLVAHCLNRASRNATEKMPE